VNIRQNEAAGFVGIESGGFDTCPKALERVKGIEPSYSAWKSPDFPMFTRAFRHFAAFWAIAIPTEFLSVGMAATTRLSEPCWHDDGRSVVRRNLLFS